MWGDRESSPFSDSLSLVPLFPLIYGDDLQLHYSCFMTQSDMEYKCRVKNEKLIQF